jgi:hypothetical protein
MFIDDARSRLCKTPARNHKVIKKGAFLGISLCGSSCGSLNCTSTVPEAVNYGAGREMADL